ncbi:hypothetical protein ISN45_Aa02g002650 [Arabidopsis thaliana x Arabidopsis arenosa]|uniref:Uncharacterized protein n=1 Tax=Arabidopsis thaliana x Arabidopsis arenosa TaxID=1240361 RepID=A0A8T2BIC9_9BRAS|nr:hypothetical protein ISN45_Aa02g002650 [Arabidopsis thaliana x Arabidopsis arenosa]
MAGGVFGTCINDLDCGIANEARIKLRCANQRLYRADEPILVDLNVCKKSNDADEGDSLPEDFYLRSDDVDELIGDSESGKESCADDVVSIDADVSELEDDEYDFLEECDECDDCEDNDDEDEEKDEEQDEEHEDFYEVEDKDYEDGDKDDEDDGDEGYNEVTESEEESLGDCDCEDAKEQGPDKVVEYSMYNKSF